MVFRLPIGLGVIGSLTMKMGAAVCGWMENFAKSKIKQEARNAQLFPHRRELWLNVNNSLFLREFMNIKPDFRLRGDDDISYF